MAKMAAPRIRQRGERAEKVESLIYMRFRGRPHGFTTEKPKKEYRACFPCREPISIQLFRSTQFQAGTPFFCSQASTPPNANRCSISRLFRQVGNGWRREGGGRGKVVAKRQRDRKTVESHPGRGRDTRKADVEMSPIDRIYILRPFHFALRPYDRYLALFSEVYGPSTTRLSFPRIRNGDSIWVGVSGVSKETIDDSVNLSRALFPRLKLFETVGRISVLILRYVSV